MSASQDDALAAAVAEHGPFPMPVGTGPVPMTPDREQKIRAEVLAEVVGWLVKKAREHRVKGPQYAKQADVIGRLADKVQRGAVRPNNLLMLPPQGGPEDVVDLRAELVRLRARVAELEAAVVRRARPVTACEACGDLPEKWCPDCAACKAGCFGGHDGNSCTHPRTGWDKAAPIETTRCGADLGPGYTCRRPAGHAGDCEPTPDPAEDPHDSPLHQSYALGRDLPEVTA